MRSKNPCRTRSCLLHGILLCLFAVSGLNAGSSCKRGCPRSDNGFLQYVPGNLYEYNFDSLMSVGLTSGNDADETALKISGQAKLFAEANCGYTLQLDHVSVSAVKESIEKQITQNIPKPVQFTMVSGELQPEICVDPTDTEYSLNIKRAIISLLQAGAEKEHETDVFGICPTLSSVSKTAGAQVVTKVRNLNSCAYREQLSNGLVNGVVNEKAGIKSSALLTADYSKELKLNRGVVEHVQLAEEYKFTGAAKGGPGAKAKVRTTMKLMNADGKPAEAPPLDGASESIIFEKPDIHAVKNINALMKVLTQTVNLVTDYVHGDAGQYFTELIRLMRSADVDALTELAAMPHPDKVLGRKVYLDALFRVGTADAVKSIVRQIPKMNEKEKKLAFLSMNLVQTVNKEALNQAASLLNGNSPKEAFLAIGNLVNRYCKHGTCDQNEVNIVSKKFVDSLRHCKANTKKDEDRIVYVLKGIRNTHKIADAAATVLIECASVAHSSRIRVAAIQAFAAASCDPKLQQKAIELLRDQNEDSEIRIEAYLAAISCPNAQVANEIAEIVNSETVYQVGGFIASNLKAIRDSTDATREAARYHLSNIRVTKKFPVDPRRYSFNSELSYGVEALGVGASADYNLIYSQHGFLPRSGRLNLTSEVFGTNFNVLEISARQENMENILEHYFGPKGLLRKEPQEILNSITSEGGARNKRSIADDTMKFGKKYKIFGSKNVNDMNFDLSMRLFGSEMFFLSLGDNIPGSADDVLKYFSTGIENTKSTLKNYQNQYHLHALFMDTEFMYPTGIGLPLELSAQGFAASKMEVAAEIDIDAIVEDYKKAKYRLKIVPSVDVNINFQLRFNAIVLSSGLRVASSMHSATGSDVHFELLNSGSGFNLNMELPREKLELIDLKMNTDFVIAEQDKSLRSIPLKTSGKKRKNIPQEHCFDQLQLFGFTICYTADFPDTPTSLVPGGGSIPQISSETNLGDFIGSMTLNLHLQSEKKFNVKGTYQQQASSQQWKLLYTTPDSKESHNTEITFDLGIKPKLFARASFDHPQKHLAVEGGIRNDDKEFVMYGQLEIDAEMTLYKIGFAKISGDQYRPIIQMSGPGGAKNDIAGYHADGMVIVKKDGPKTHYQFENFQVLNKDNDRLVINGFVDIGSTSFKSDLKVSPGKEVYAIKAHFNLDPSNGHSIGVFINNEKEPKNILGGSLFLLLADNRVKGEILAQAGDVHFQANHDIEYNKNEKDMINTSKFKHSIGLIVKGSVMMSGKLDGEFTANKMLQFNAETSWLNKKKASIVFKIVVDQNNRGDYDLDILMKLNKHFIDIKSKCEAKGSRYMIDNDISSSWGTHLTAQGEIGQRFTIQDIYIDLHGIILLANVDKENKWMMKAVGQQDKMISEFKMERDNAELISFNGELMHPQEKGGTTGKINIQLKDVLGAKTDFRINKAGKGDLTAVLNLKKAGRKINIDSKFTIATPKYDLETTMVFDNNKKIYFKTENIMEKLKFSTKNIIDLADQKLLLDLSGFVKGEWWMNGEIDAKLSLTVPSGRKIDGILNRKMTTASKTGLSHGSALLQFEDQLPNNGDKLSLAVNTKLDKYNAKTKEFNSETHIVYTGYDGKKYDVKYNGKHLPKGQYKMIEYNVIGRGELYNSPVDFNFVIDEYSPAHAIFRISGKFGEFITGNINGNYYMKGRGQPSTYEIQANVNVPQSEFKKLAFTSSGKYLKPETDDGVHLAEIHIDENSGNGQAIQLNTVVKGSKAHGSFSWDLATDRMKSPLKIDGSYDRELQASPDTTTSSSGKQKYIFNYSYGDDQFLKNTIDLSFTGSEGATLYYKLQSSFESVKTLDLAIRSQKFENAYNLRTQAEHNGQQYSLETTFHTGDHKKGLQLQINFPQDQPPPITFIGIFELLGERKAKLILEIANLGDLDLIHNSEISYKTLDDFYVVAKMNSKKLKIDQFDLDIRAQGEGTKGVIFNVKNANGVILAGSATYALKTEKNKSIIEGQGQIQYYQKTSSANFKLIRQIYDMANDDEVGFSYTFNGIFGPKNAVSTLKITNKNFHARMSVCEEKKQCTNIEIRSIISIDVKDISIVQHDLMILIDLRKLGYPHEFELQSNSTRQGFKFQYELESNIISNSNMKYQLIANVQPTHSKIQIKLPSREILFETEQVFPERGHIFGHYKNSAAFYFDKVNKPNEITRMEASADVSGVERVAINIKGMLKFEHPSIRTLSVSGQFDANRDLNTVNTEIIFDLFRVPEQKIIASARIQNDATKRGFNVTTENGIRSDGLGFQYDVKGHTALSADKNEFSSGITLLSGSSDLEMSGFMFGNENSFGLLVNGMNDQMIDIKGEINRKNYGVKFNSLMKILGSNTVTFSTEMEPSMAKFAINNEGLIDAKGEIKLGKEAKFDVNSNGKKLYNGRVALDAAHFLSITYETSEEEIEKFMTTVENDVTENTKKGRAAIEKRFKKIKESIERQIQLAKDSAPDFTQLQANYQTNVNDIIKELENDPSLKQFINNYRSLYETLAKFANDLAKVMSTTYEKLHVTVSVLYEKLLGTFNEAIVPALEEFSKKMITVIGKLRVEAIRLSKDTMKEVFAALKSFEPELKALGKPITELLKPLNESLQELFKALSVEFDEMIKEVKEYLAKLPTFEAITNEIKQKISKLKAIDEVLKFLRDVVDQLQQLPVNADTQQLINKLYNYIEAKLKSTPVNDIEAIEDLYTTFLNALRSMWQNWSDANGSIGSTGAAGFGSGFFSAIPFSLDLFSKIPAWISFKFSIFNFIYNEKFESLTENGIFSLLQPPYDFLPPYTLKGHVADGQHFFTFDGKHIRLPGTCKYILAQDSIDNNFTVIATLKEGKMKAITLVDVGNFVEINDAGVLKVNGKASEYPIHMDDMHVWRNYYTTWMHSQYGVEVICSTDLKVCHIHIDGFYTSKTRGLLGNGNAEPHDDFTNVDGTLAENYATFGNGYGLGNCPPIAFEELQTPEHDPICSDLFGMDSTLLFGYMFIDSSLYREACDQNVKVAAGKDEEVAACNIAFAYASAARLEDLPVMLPTRCVKCTGGGGGGGGGAAATAAAAAGGRDYGSEISVKTPTNKADIVFVVDTGSSKDILDNLVTPAIGELRHQLKTRGFTDVQIAVIAYNEQQEYPSLLTSNGGKINYQGQFNTIVLNGPTKEEPLDVGIEKVNNFIKMMTTIYEHIAPGSDEHALRMALQYPFRTGSAKSIVAVRSEPLEFGNMLRFIRAHLASVITKFDGAILHMIAPVKELALDGVPVEKIVGFNSRIVATTEGKDAKKRQKLKFSNDMGIDFVLGSGGWVFAAQNFKQEQEAFLNQVTTSIADTLFKTEIVSDCKCIAAYGLHGQHKCVNKSTTFVPNKRPKGSKK